MVSASTLFYFVAIAEIVYGFSRGYTVLASAGSAFIIIATTLVYLDYLVARQAFKALKVAVGSAQLFMATVIAVAAAESGAPPILAAAAIGFPAVILFDYLAGTTKCYGSLGYVYLGAQAAALMTYTSFSMNSVPHISDAGLLPALGFMLIPVYAYICAGRGYTFPIESMSTENIKR